MTIRFGILGAGRIGQTHARAIHGAQGADITAIADPHLPAAQQISDTYGAEIGTIEEIVKRPDIDAIAICTPTDMHADLIELSARHAKAIFCEKPIDLSAERVRACLKASNFDKTFAPKFCKKFSKN